MTIVIPPGYAQFSIEFWLTDYNRPAVNVWGVDCRDNIYAPDTMASGFLDIIGPSIAAGIDSNVTMRDVRMVLGQDGADPVVGFSTGSYAGTAVRESTAPALACLINLNTGLGGRRNRGRKYLPWALNDTSVSEKGAVENSAVTGWNTRMAAVKTAMAANEWVPVLLHGTGSSAVPDPTPVTTMTCSPVISTQRQRQARF